jgi:ADP-ribosyl-[dinitrogen reductase] hydrolase
MLLRKQLTTQSKQIWARIGYVIDCLEAARWYFLQTESFRDAILRAVNLGDDADTTAAVCGQIAGAYYGEQGIPEAWRQRVVQYELIAHCVERLLAVKAQL